MRAALLALAVALASACTTAAPPPRPVLGLEAQATMLRSRVDVYDDPEVTQLVARVAAALQTDEERAGSPEILIVRDPTIGAFTLPTGTIYLHTGLLARLETEAQLATILGRALTHAAQRSALGGRAAGGAIDDALIAMPATVAAVVSTTEPMVEVLSPVAEAILGARLDAAYGAAVTG